MPQQLYAPNPFRGAVMVTGAALLFSVMGVLVKLMAHELPNAQVVFFRNVFGLVFLVPWLIRGGIHGLATTKYWFHLLRAVAGLGAMYCYFHVIGQMPLAEATLYTFTAPLFIPLIARAWLRETLSGIIWAAVLIGFAGVVVILRPGTGHLVLASVIGLMGGLMAALAQVSIRRVSATEPTTRIVFYFAVHATVISAVPLAGVWVDPSPQLWLYGVLAGLAATMAQLLLTRGYAHAPAGKVAPLNYFSLVFAGLIGWWGWGEVPDGWMWLGTLLICISGVLATRRAGIPVAAMYSVVREKIRGE